APTGPGTVQACRHSQRTKWPRAVPRRLPAPDRKGEPHWRWHGKWYWLRPPATRASRPAPTRKRYPTSSTLASAYQATALNPLLNRIFTAGSCCITAHIADVRGPALIQLHSWKSATNDLAAQLDSGRHRG